MRRKLFLAGSALTAVAAWVLLRRRRKSLRHPRHEVTLTAVRDKVWIMCSCGWDGDDAVSVEDAIAAGRRHAAAAIRLDRGAGLESIETIEPPLNPVGALRI